MSWLARYRARMVLRKSLWITPIAGAVLTVMFANALRWFDARMGWNCFGFTPDGARALVSAIAGSMLTFLVFVLSSILLVLQFATSQLTPRAVAMIGANIHAKSLIAVLLSSFVFSLSLSARIETDWVPQASVAFDCVYCVFAITVFIRFVQQFSESLRPAFVLQRIGEMGRTAVDQIYRTPFEAVSPRPDGLSATLSRIDATLSHTIAHRGRSGVVLAFVEADLVEYARRAGVIVELVPQVGDFISRGDPLFRVHPATGSIADEALLQCVAVGAERTIEQDPAFALRMMVDIAVRALSPAINDPTTAVVAIDQIHSTLHYVGRRHLDVGTVRDTAGAVRLVFRAPRWADLVALATCEIRLYGATSFQVPRRLKAMLTHLIKVLPPARTPALVRELDAVRDAIGRNFSNLDDRRNAEVADVQGVGGASEIGPTST